MDFFPPAAHTPDTLYPNPCRTQTVSKLKEKKNPRALAGPKHLYIFKRKSAKRDKDQFIDRRKYAVHHA